MVLIFSIFADRSTKDVTQWLNYFGVSYKLVSEFDFIKDIGIEENTITIKYENKSICMDNYDAIWCRRGGGIVWSIERRYRDDTVFTKYLFDYELKSIKKALIHSIKRKRHLNNITDFENNKITSLQLAFNIGLSVPKWIVTSNIDEIEEFPRLAHVSHTYRY